MDVEIKPGFETGHAVDISPSRARIILKSPKETPMSTKTIVKTTQPKERIFEILQKKKAQRPLIGAASAKSQLRCRELLI